MNWKVICSTFSRQIAKYTQTLNYLLEINFFPSVFITKLFLHPLKPLYKTCLQFKSTSKYSLVQHFWSLASKVFFPLLWLHVFYCITASCLTLQQFNLWQWEIQFPFATVLLLTISALPYRFLAVLYLVTTITVDESFDASSIHPTDLPLLFPALYLFLGILLSHSCLKMVKFHHPGFFFSMRCSSQEGSLPLF